MQKPLMIFIGAASVLIVAYFVYATSPGPCANILDQKAPKLSLSVNAVKATGALVIGSEKVQDVSDSARKVGAHLTACCIAQHSDRPLPPDQYQACVNGAKDYEAKIIQITNIIKEADTAKEQGNTQLAEQKAAEAKKTVDASASIERYLGKLAKPGPSLPPASDTPKPWEETKAVIKLKNGKSAVVAAKTVSTNYSFCGGDGLTLDYGQSVPFKNMQSFAVLDEKPTIEIVAFNGEHLTGGVSSNCGITTNTEVGRFETNISNIERVDFGR